MQSLLEYRRQKRHAEDENTRKLNRNGSTGQNSDDVLTSQKDDLEERESAQTSPSRNGSSENEEGNSTQSKSKEINVKSDDDHNDQANPRNWTWTKRLWTTTILFFLVFSQGWVSACDSKITKNAGKEFHVSQTSDTLGTALFLFGISAGSLIAGPLSEQLGRNPLYLASTLVYLCFTLGAALAPNFGAQITLRFLAGFFSSPTLSMYGGSLADMFNEDERQKVWPIFALSPLLSPVLAPVAGGWIQDNTPWRWVYWIGLILSGAAFILAFLCLPETFSPMILQWRTYHLRKVTGNEHYTCELEGQDSLMQRIGQNLTRPAKFFTTEPIIIALGTYLTVIYVDIFTFLSGFDFVFKDTYGLSPGITSLAFVAITIGALISTALMPLFNFHKRRLLRKNNYSGGGPPEYLLFPALVASPFFAISLFWLGWTNYISISYWSGYAATVLFGYSMTAIFVSSYIYIINSYGTASSSALGSITMVRYFVSAGMVVAARPMYQGIGVHWSLTFLGGLGLLCVPMPFLIYRYGSVLRKKSKFAEDEEEEEGDEGKAEA